MRNLIPAIVVMLAAATFVSYAAAVTNVRGGDRPVVVAYGKTQLEAEANACKKALDEYGPYTNEQATFFWDQATLQWGCALRFTPIWGLAVQV
jgi:hypothetical protein